MSEIWVAAAVTVVGGAVAGKAAEKKDKGDKAHQAAMTEEESKLSAQRTGYESALEEFYTQRERQRKQRGLDQFRQFSTMGEFAPNYNIDTEARIDPGKAPNYNTFDPDYDPNQSSEIDPATGKKKSSFMDKAMKHDPVLRPISDAKKLVKKIF